MKKDIVRHNNLEWLKIFCLYGTRHKRTDEEDEQEMDIIVVVGVVVAIILYNRRSIVQFIRGGQRRRRRRRRLRGNFHEPGCIAGPLDGCIVLALAAYFRPYCLPTCLLYVGMI